MWLVYRRNQTNFMAINTFSSALVTENSSLTTEQGNPGKNSAACSDISDCRKSGTQNECGQVNEQVTGSPRYLQRAKLWQVTTMCIFILAETSCEADHILQTTATASKDSLTLCSIKLPPVLFDKWDTQGAQAQLIFAALEHQQLCHHDHAPVPREARGSRPETNSTEVSAERAG